MLSILTGPPTELLSTSVLSPPGFRVSFKVGPRTRYLWVKMWGEGGSGAPLTDGSDGGAGGFAQALIPVTPGETLTYDFGRGYAYGHYMPSGGFTGLFRDNTPLLIAAGGGAGDYHYHYRAGAGGGLVGQGGELTDGETATTGGTQSEGGHTANSDAQYSGRYLAGGPNVSAGPGGPGGGGFYGGAGASFGGGAGGSSFIGADGNSHASTTAGNRAAAPNTADADYVAGVAIGGQAGSTGPYNIVPGGPGLIVIREYSGDPFAAGLLT